MLAGAGAAALAKAAETDAAKPIELHVDLSVDPAKEKEMLHNFHTIFKPAAIKQNGYMDVNVMKLRQTVAGTAPQGMNYRFVLKYKSEELRQVWVNSATHKRVWPTVEKTLTNTNYNVLLFDLA
jgi:hypothetical protein